MYFSHDGEYSSSQNDSILQSLMERHPLGFETTSMDIEDEKHNDPPEFYSDGTFKTDNSSSVVNYASGLSMYSSLAYLEKLNCYPDQQIASQTSKGDEMVQHQSFEISCPNIPVNDVSVIPSFVTTLAVKSASPKQNGVVTKSFFKNANSSDDFSTNSNLSSSIRGDSIQQSSLELCSLPLGAASMDIEDKGHDEPCEPCLPITVRNSYYSSFQNPASGLSIGSSPRYLEILMSYFQQISQTTQDGERIQPQLSDTSQIFVETNPKETVERTLPELDISAITKFIKNKSINNSPVTNSKPVLPVKYISEKHAVNVFAMYDVQNSYENNSDIHDKKLKSTPLPENIHRDVSEYSKNIASVQLKKSNYPILNDGNDPPSKRMKIVECRNQNNKIPVPSSITEQSLKDGKGESTNSPTITKKEPSYSSVVQMASPERNVSFIPKYLKNEYMNDSFCTNSNSLLPLKSMPEKCSDTELSTAPAIEPNPVLTKFGGTLSTEELKDILKKAGVPVCRESLTNTNDGYLISAGKLKNDTLSKEKFETFRSLPILSSSHSLSASISGYEDFATNASTSSVVSQKRNSLEDVRNSHLNNSYIHNKNLEPTSMAENICRKEESECFKNIESVQLKEANYQILNDCNNPPSKEMEIIECQNQNNKIIIPSSITEQKFNCIRGESTNSPTSLHVPSTSGSSNLHVPSTSGSSNLHTPSTSGSSNLHVPGTSGSSNLHVPGTSGSSNLHVPETSGSSNLHMPATSGSSNLHVPGTSGSSNFHVPGTSGSSNLHFPSISGSSNLHVPWNSSLSSMHGASWKSFGEEEPLAEGRKRFISPKDVLYSLMDWETSWLQNQMKTGCCPQFFTGLEATKDSYKNPHEYTDTYFGLQKVNLWLKVYQSWRKQLFSSFSAYFYFYEEHSFYFKNICRATVAEEHIPVNQDFILVTFTRINGESQHLFGFANNVKVSDHTHGLGSQRNIEFTFLSTKKLLVKLRSTIQIQKLCNIRVALKQFSSLEVTHTTIMKDVFLDPRNHAQSIGFIEVPRCCSSAQLELLVHKIVSSDSQFMLVIHQPYTDSFVTLSSLILGFVPQPSPILVCLRDAKKCFEMSEMMQSDFVLALKEDEVRDIPGHLQKFTLRAKASCLLRMNLSSDLCGISLEDAELKVLKDSKTILTDMSSIFLSHNRKADLGSNLVCLIDEAHMYTESETIVPLSYNPQTIVLLGYLSKNLDLHPILQSLGYQKSLFFRLFQGKML